MNNNNNTYPMQNHYSTGECAAATRLVELLLEQKCLLSVNDGEEWVVKKSDKKTTILEALGSTGEDMIKVRDPAGTVLGVFYLVWGNADDGSELVADQTDNAFCEAIDAKLSAAFA